MSIKEEISTEEDWRITPNNILGMPEAENEWARDSTEFDPAKQFIHTKTYIDFKKEDLLYLFGPRGSGKTAIIKMNHFQIDNNNSNQLFRYSWVINQENAYHELENYIFKSGHESDLSHPYLVSILKPQWLWILKVSAMQAVIQKDYEKESINKDIENIYAYLLERGFISETPNRGPANVFSKIPGIDKTRTEPKPIELIDYFNYIERNIDERFRDAEKSLDNLLARRGPCLVMIDSLEYYDLKNTLPSAIVTSLIESIQSIYKDFLRRKCVLAKAVFPLETRLHMVIHNKEKVTPRSIYIYWTYREIISLIAKRYHSLIRGKLQEEKDIELDLDDYSVAKEFLYSYFPKKIKSTTYNIEVDTLFYIIRHTQRRPRQVLYIFNNILTLAKKTNKDYMDISSENVIHGTHANLHNLIVGALNAFDSVYPGADKIIMDILSDKPNIFGEDELNKWLSYFSGTMDRRDLKELLLESNVIGYISNKKSYTNNSRMRLIVALFEYHRSDVLRYTAGERKYAIHPMYYQELGNSIDENNYIIPIFAGEEKEILYEFS